MIAAASIAWTDEKPRQRARRAGRIGVGSGQARRAAGGCNKEI